MNLHLDIGGTRVRAGLEAALRATLQNGRLAPGTRLPSSRALAADLGIARNTVAEAYGQLIAEGWLTGRTGSGTLLTPAHQFPLGVTLAPQRRRDAVEWAIDGQGVVIEDDYDGEFRYDRQPVGALQALAPGHVVYAGTASKSLAPGLRLGWLVVPPHLLGDVVAAAQMTGALPGALDQLTLAGLIISGAYDRQIRQARLEYRRRRDGLVTALAREVPLRHTGRVMPVTTGTRMLRPGSRVRRGIEAASRDGAAFVADALSEHALASIKRELAAARFGKLAGREGRARQEGEILVLTGPLRGYPAIRQLRGELVAAARGLAAAIPGLDAWDPDEVAVQRYHAGALGITPHLDLKRYGYLVAVATVHGSAAFTWCRNRDGDPLATWQAGPGSLVLLRGPGLAGTADGRPLHAVSGPVTGRRISLGFRMYTRRGPSGPRTRDAGTSPESAVASGDAAR